MIIKETGTIEETAIKPVIQCRSVTKSYHQGDERVRVLGDLQCTIAEGELVAIVGSSGSGKSTLLNLMGGLDAPDNGEVLVGGQPVKPMSESERARWRNRHLGFVFQQFNLIPVLTAYENIELPLLLTRLGRAERRQHVETALRLVGLADRASHFPRQLSGGEQQRVAIARALVIDPTLILADEPTGDLDARSAEDVLQVLTQLNRDHGKTILMVTHDPRAAAHAPRVCHLEKGILLPPDAATAAMATH